MSTQITGSTSTPVEAQQRSGLMAALAVAEHVVSVSPIVPTDVKASCPAFAASQPSVDVFFFGCPEGVYALAGVLGGSATMRPFRESDPRPYTSVEVVVSGVPVTAWALMAGTVAEAADASGALAEQRHLLDPELDYTRGRTGGAL